MTKSEQLPWSHDTELNLSDFLKKSMSVASTIMENEQVRQQASKHLGSLIQLRQRDRPVTEDVGVFNRLFKAAEQQMADAQDKKVLSLLKAQVATFIGASFDAPEFTQAKDEAKDDDEENEPRLSWATVANQGKRLDENERPDDPFGPERAEFDHHHKMAADYNTYDRGDDEDDQQAPQEEEDNAPRERGMGGRPGQGQWAPAKRRYRRNEYRRPNASNSAFHPTPLGPLPAGTYCIPAFFPNEESYDLFHAALSSAKKTLHVAIFSLTDNKTANALIDAKERGVDVKVVADDGQLDAKGSDVVRLRDDYNIPIKIDDNAQFMHNKFAVIDDSIVITGSFNWSIGARYHNKENILITNIASVAEAYSKEFQHLWQILYDA
ncbi:phospholipase D/nuclease [Hesseltinella vesiculosa]|uniref:Mitochondrial cardiolipin hydrolase n=1 Tax=Hesseltinella vesiculosa TaxID=101127 RepID=A0A1X2GG59_9FUNG|nr:phospholipase D/nuclease [Hesseltinella vesiculosa]